ncbi:putrescine ABC transporter permease PotI [Stenotrophomonas maltophilia]|jgi:putrescine transport system permease protein|uniref:ABC transporter permease subunit n=5 Tax=Stenotrophomonas TaxID=40323 RepID=A0A246L3V9_9GAMM|nr:MULTISPECIES: ABC transporter permease subunit [Stenotrophomonas]KDE89082.1 spermidine/putrescine ABC transporter permease [Stenotrophomonas maltophilia M30]QCZ96771.1 putrescine ABC transporter permease PotI [Stenotrophomonas sp. pho]TGR51957.1 ABC transporter permease subunit [bacterium M00.F.Ca.ET.199.01.1.1]TGT05558.1 ABC transporter permease subunit [bacterium M00.F.Ca.ET.177.01.1.1]TGT62634.1 ABC transporter permease subunit [Mesorhizobium sp. M00.F.Ca.ET.170.01.1.1]TGU14263.1 ABC tr
MSPRTAKGLGLGVLLLGFAFLYLPILLLMFYSFNSSRLAMVWAGFSTRAYSDLFADRALMDAMWTSLVVAFWTACTATVLGTLAAMVMTRFKRFRGKPLFGALVTAPLVMPDVILGFSLMALLASMGAIPGFPARGLATIWIAHVTFTLCFVTVVVSSRLQEMDLSLEEAAMDLGASRLTVFTRITLPIIAPALVAGWLLAFTLSLDDVVVASFVATPGSTTLPMKVFASVRMGISPKINALATLLVSAVSIAAVIGWYINARAEKRRQRDLQLARQDNG